MDFTLFAMLIGGIIIGTALGYLIAAKKSAGLMARAEYDTLSNEFSAVSARLEDAQSTIISLEHKLAHEQSAHTQTKERSAASTITIEEQKIRLEEQKASLSQMQEQMEQKFKNLSNELLEKMGTKFNADSEKKLGELLTPMRTRLNEFSELVTKSFNEQGKEQRSLKDEIGKIVLQADSLSKALRGDVKAQGNWGEIMLERILEESGLQKNTDYVLQGADMQLKNDSGAHQQPDVIVKLPEEKHIIIDSKVSLTAYDRYCSSDDDMEREGYVKDFIRSIRAHVNGLADKRYQDLDKLAAPDFVMLFMPIEGAFSLAMQADPQLHSFAWDKKIILVCPTTLFATLRTVASLWRIENQNRNSEEIAKRGAALYDKFVGFVDDLHAVGKQIDQAKGKYDTAIGKLSTGAGNLVRQTEMMKSLGLKTNKTLPKELVNADADVALLEDS